jgi:hypothetical protein
MSLVQYKTPLLSSFWFRRLCPLALEVVAFSYPLFGTGPWFLRTSLLAKMIIHAPSVPTIIGVLSFLLSLNVLAVFLRLYARRALGQKLQVDDWLMVPAIIGTFGCAACLFHGMYRAP